jgi:hypothetical protein
MNPDHKAPIFHCESPKSFPISPMSECESATPKHSNPSSVTANSNVLTNLEAGYATNTEHSWQRWSENPRMVNRTIKDLTRKFIRDASRSTTAIGNSSSCKQRRDRYLIDHDLFSEIIAAATFLGCNGKLDTGGWEALRSLGAWLEDQHGRSWADGASIDPDDDDINLIKTKGQYSELQAMVLQAMQQQHRKRRESAR